MILFDLYKLLTDRDFPERSERLRSLLKNGRSRASGALATRSFLAITTVAVVLLFIGWRALRLPEPSPPTRLITEPGRASSQPLARNATSKPVVRTLAVLPFDNTSGVTNPQPAVFTDPHTRQQKELRLDKYGWDCHTQLTNILANHALCGKRFDLAPQDKVCFALKKLQTQQAVGGDVTEELDRLFGVTEFVGGNITRVFVNSGDNMVADTRVRFKQVTVELTVASFGVGKPILASKVFKINADKRTTLGNGSQPPTDDVLIEDAITKIFEQVAADKKFLLKLIGVEQ